MTTPTREQVVQWDELEDIGAVKDDCNGFPWKRIGYTCETDLARLEIGTKVYAPDAVAKAVTLAIADLEAKVAELEAENARLTERRCEICGYAEHHREHTGCLRKQLAAEQLRSERLREAMQQEINYHFMQAGPKDLPNIKRALSEPHDTAALDAYVAEKIKEAGK